MSLKRICEIGIVVLLLMLLKNAYFMFFSPFANLNHIFWQYQTLFLVLEYGLLILFQILFSLYLYKKQFNLALVIWIVFYLMNLRSILTLYTDTAWQFTADGEIISTINWDAIIFNILALLGGLSLVLTRARKELFLSIYGYLNIVVVILLFQQISSPNHTVITVVQVINSFAIIFVLLQFITERRKLPNRNAQESDLLDDLTQNDFGTEN